MHILCTICSDLVNPAENLHATKCGHLFHYHCLSQWIERSKSCPQCRHKVTEKCMFRIYPTVSNENTGEDITTVQSRLDDALLQLRQHKATSKEKEKQLTNVTADLKKNEELLKNFEKKLVSRDSTVAALKEQLEYVKIQNKETQRLKDENESLKKNMQTLNGLQKVLNATSDEVEQMLQGYTDVRTVATFATALKRALCESESKKNELRERLQSANQSWNAEKSNVQSLQVKLAQLEEKLIQAELNVAELKKQQTQENDDPKAQVKVVPPQKLEEDWLSPFTMKGMVTETRPSEFNKAMCIDSPKQMDKFAKLVKTIEDSDSPYLNLKQSSLALTALQQRPKQMAPQNKLKPSEVALLNTARGIAMKKPAAEANTSIFQKKAKMTLPFDAELERKFLEAKMETSYDGLGGHSKPDIFPTPTKPPLKSCVPRLSAKHKLKRPAPRACQDIGQMLAKLRDQ